jgi:hypothetical protein
MLYSTEQRPPEIPLEMSKYHHPPDRCCNNSQDRNSDDINMEQAVPDQDMDIHHNIVKQPILEWWKQSRRRTSNTLAIPTISETKQVGDTALSLPCTINDNNNHTDGMAICYVCQMVFCLPATPPVPTNIMPENSLLKYLVKTTTTTTLSSFSTTLSSSSSSSSSTTKHPARCSGCDRFCCFQTTCLQHCHNCQESFCTFCCTKVEELKGGSIYFYCWDCHRDVLW